MTHKRKMQPPVNLCILVAAACSNSRPARAGLALPGGNKHNAAPVMSDPVLHDILDATNSEVIPAKIYQVAQTAGQDELSIKSLTECSRSTVNGNEKQSQIHGSTMGQDSCLQV